MLEAPAYRHRARSPPPHVYPAAGCHPRLSYAVEHAYGYQRPYQQPVHSTFTLAGYRAEPPVLPSIHSLTSTTPSSHFTPRVISRPAYSSTASDLGRSSVPSKRRREASPVRRNSLRDSVRTPGSLAHIVKQEPREYNYFSPEHTPVSLKDACKYEAHSPLTPLSLTFASSAMTPVPSYKWPADAGDDKWLPVEGEADAQSQTASTDQKRDGLAIDPALSSVRSSAENAAVQAAAEAVAAAAAASTDQDITMASAPEIRLPETLGSASASPAIDTDPKPVGTSHGNGEGLGVPEKKDTPFSRSPELRVSHKLAERKRRKEMRDLFDELREQLPADRGMKASKWEILSKAVDYIQALKTQVTDASRTVEMLHRDLALARGETPGNPTPWTSSYHNFSIPYVPHAGPAHVANPPATQPQASVPQPAAQPAPAPTPVVPQQPAAQPAQVAPAPVAQQPATMAAAPAAQAPQQQQQQQQPVQPTAQPAAEAPKTDA